MTANVSEPKDNGEWTAQIAQFGKQHFLTHLLKLLLALECDAWVRDLHGRPTNFPVIKGLPVFVA
jgi:hypothetical protein